MKTKNTMNNNKSINQSSVLLGRLKDARKSNKIRLTTVAKRLNVDKSVISKLENTNKDIQIGTLIKYIEAMNGELVFTITIGNNTKELKLI